MEKAFAVKNQASAAKKKEAALYQLANKDSRKMVVEILKNDWH